jgi:hypothetical protein
LRRLFGQLLAVEEERKERLAVRIADIDGSDTPMDQASGEGSFNNDNLESFVKNSNH